MAQVGQTPHNNQSISVSELNRRARSLLENQLNQVWVAGEISNFSRPSSGHWYFTLKDSQAQIRCAMFKGRNMLLRQTPKAGDQVIVRGKISLYEARGDYQLIAESMKLAGEGLLQQQFEALKQRLFDEGLFDPSLKRPLPERADKIAIISSATGAAVHDILQVLKRRDASIEVVLIPATVQGELAPRELRSALRTAQELPDLDAIIIGRGGGSLEDLWAFNDELLAREISQCSLPIISAVGHEIDFSICDFVADVRAPTPSAAAELISKDSSEVLRRAQSLHARLRSSWQRLLSWQQERVSHLGKQLKHPGEKIQQWQQRCDRAEQGLRSAIDQRLEHSNNTLKQQQRLLQSHNPAQTLPQSAKQLGQLQKRLINASHNMLNNKRNQVAKVAGELDIVSPLATLNRGYSINKNADGRIIRSVEQVNIDDVVELHFADGQAQAKVLGVDPKSTLFKSQ